MELDGNNAQQQTTSSVNAQKVAELQKEIAYMEAGGYNKDNNPHVASLHQQLQKYAPSPSKELRGKAQLMSDLATLEKHAEADAKSFEQGLKKLNEELAAVQSKKDQLLQQQAAQMQIWEEARAKITTLIQNAPESPQPTAQATPPKPPALQGLSRNISKHNGGSFRQIQ